MSQCRLPPQSLEDRPQTLAHEDNFLPLYLTPDPYGLTRWIIFHRICLKSGLIAIS